MRNVLKSSEWTRGRIEKLCEKHSLTEVAHVDVETVAALPIVRQYPWIVEIAAQIGTVMAGYPENGYGGWATLEISLFDILVVDHDYAQDALVATLEACQDKADGFGRWWIENGIDAVWRKLLRCSGANTLYSSDRAWDIIITFVERLRRYQM
jgi:hypothetical protein